jgi:hypothetical protein
MDMNDKKKQSDSEEKRMKNKAGKDYGKPSKMEEQESKDQKKAEKPSKHDDGMQHPALEYETYKRRNDCE